MRAVLEVAGDPRSLWALTEDDVPDAPASQRSALEVAIPRGIAGIGPRPDASVRWLSSRLLIELSFGKVQPKSTCLVATRLFLGAQETTAINFQAKVYADNLPTPIESSLEVAVTVRRLGMSLEDLELEAGRLTSQWS